LVGSERSRRQADARPDPGPPPARSIAVAPTASNLSTATLFSNGVDSLIAKVDQKFASRLLTGRTTWTGFKEWELLAVQEHSRLPRLVLELRAEFFNFVNHPNFSNPILPGISDPATNGINPATGRGIGNLALTATGDVGIGNPFLGGGGPRGGTICR
jgi:hypothetical protein